MAKKEKDEFADFSFDSDLDFDFDLNPASTKPQKTKGPIGHIIEGAKSSLKSKFSDPSSYKSMLRKAMPDPAGVAWDAIETVAQDSKDLYDQATKELRPHLSSISSKIDQLTPDSAKRAKALSRAVKDKLSIELPDSYSSHQSSAEDNAVERMMQEMGARASESSEDSNNRDNVKRILDEHIANDRFNSQQAALNIIANNTSSIRAYNKTVGVKLAYKSLEVQTRSYFALANLVRINTEMAERNKQFQNALLHNTSLPDYAKTSNTERWKQVSKEQLFGTLNDGLFGKGKSRIKAAGNRLMKAGKEKLANSKESLADIDSMLEMLIDSREMAMMDAEMNGKKYSGWNTAGNFAGSMGGDAIMDFLSSNLKRAAEKNPKFMKRAYTGGRYAANPGALLEKVRDSKRFKSMGNSENEITQMLHAMGGSLMDLLGAEKPDMTIKSTAIGSQGENKLHTQMKVSRSLTDVIPGYLARILREMTIMRTGDTKTGLLVFDSKSDKFKTEGRMASDLVDRLRGQAKESRAGNEGRYNENSDKLYKSFVGKETVAGPDSRNIQTFLNKLATSSADMDFTGQGIRKTAEYKSLDPATRSIVDKLLDKRFSGNTDVDEARKFRLTNAANKTRDSVGNLMGPIQEMIRDGHGDALESKGILTRDKNGDWKVNEAAYHKFFDDTIGDSDFDMKGNIRKFDPKGSYNAVKNTQNYTWSYKNGTGYDKRKVTGPMAQDVQKNFGNDTAPGGTKIDLVNMNGHVTAAVQKLAEMVESMGAGEALQYLRKIEENTRGGGAGGGAGGRPRSAGEMFSSLLGKAGEGLGAAGRKVAKGAGVASDAAQDFWTNNKEDFKKARDKAIEMAVYAADKAVAFGSDLLYNQMPKLGSRIKGYLGKAKDFAKNLLQDAKDLYVAGSESPAIKAVLLQAGQYRDQATNKVMRTMDDIATSKGDIVDSAGRVVLSLQDRAQGVYDSTGRKLKSFYSDARDFALGAAAWAGEKIQSGLGSLKDKWKGTDFKGIGSKFSDRLKGGFGKLGFGRGGGTDERILPVLVQIRDLISLSHSGKRGKAIMARNIPGVEPYSDMVADVEELVSSVSGQPMHGPTGPVSAAMASGNYAAAARAAGSRAGQAAGNLFGINFQGLSGIGGRLKNAYQGSSLPGRLSGTKAAGMFGTAKGRLGGMFGRLRGGKLGSFGSKMGKGLGGIFGMLSGAAGAAGAAGGQGQGQNGFVGPMPEDSGENTYGADDHAARLADLNAGTAAKGYQAGEHSTAGDRVQAAENAKRANEERKQAGIEAGMRGARAKAGRFAAEEGGISKMIAMATSGLSSIAGVASNLIGGIGDLFGLGKGVVSGAMTLGKGLFKAGSVLGTGIGAVGKGLGTIGKGITGVASRLPGAARVARIGATAMRVASVAGLATGGLSGMAGSVVALGGALLTNPIVLGALAVAGVGYLGYKAYKYLTRNSIDDFQRIRFMQYGLTGDDSTKAYNSKCIALEEYFLDGRIAFSMGSPSINSRTVKNEELLELMDIPADDPDQVGAFTEWLNARFAPVLMKHVGALYRVDPKASLSKVSNLEGPKIADYLTNVEVGSVWSYTQSPFKGLDSLSSDPAPARALIDKLIKENKGKDSEKKKTDAAATKSPGASTLPTKEEITSRQDAKAAQSTNVPASNVPALPPGSQAAKYLSDTRAVSSTGTISFGKPAALGTEDNVSDGSAGMQYVKLGKDAVLEGMHPAMLKAFLGMAQEYGEKTGKKLPVNEAFRSYQRQAELYAKHPDKAARPGSSLHEYGLAMDLPTVVMKELEEIGLLKKYGFTRPIRGETWHMESSGIQGAIQAVKTDASLAEQLINASYGRGGGGIGASPSQKKGGRDAETAKSVFGDGLVGGTGAPAPATGAGAQTTSETDVDTGKGPAPTGPNAVAQAALGIGPAAGPAATGPGAQSSKGADGSVKFTGNNDASGSLGDGTGKFDAVKKQIADAAREGGQDPNKMMLMAAMESGLNPNAKAKGTSAEGGFQFLDASWKEQVGKTGAKYGLGADASRTDIRASTLMAGDYMSGKTKALEKAKGGALDIVDEYMGHMFGAGGASSLLRAGNDAIAAQVLPQAAKSNQETFYENGRPRTVGELRTFLSNKLSKKAKEFGIQVPGLSAVGTSPGTTAPSMAAASQSVPTTSGYGLPNAVSAPDTSIKAPGVGFDTPAPKRKAPSEVFKSKAPDSSMSASVDVFERFSRQVDTQTGHLASINDGINQRMVPLLEQIVANTGGGGGSKGGMTNTSADGSNASGGGSSSAAPVKKTMANVSSFDNRRALPA